MRTTGVSASASFRRSDANRGYKLFVFIADDRKLIVRLIASYPTRSSGQRANKLVFSMADNPLGPFEFKGEIIDNHSLNIHGSIAEFKDKWYLFYHVAGPSNWERRVCAVPLSYNDDDTILPIEISTSR